MTQGRTSQRNISQRPIKWPEQFTMPWGVGRDCNSVDIHMLMTYNRYPWHFHSVSKTNSDSKGQVGRDCKYTSKTHDSLRSSEAGMGNADGSVTWTEPLGRESQGSNLKGLVKTGHLNCPHSCSKVLGIVLSSFLRTFENSCYFFP